MPAKPKVNWEGAQSLRRLLVPIDECVPHPENPRRGNLDVIEESLRAFGQVRPILVNKRSGYIVAGNHTYRAVVERLGWNRVARVLADLDPDEERRYLLMDNRSSDLGEYDVEAQGRLLAELAETGKLEGTGYSEKAVADLTAQAAEIARRAQEDDVGSGGNGGEPRPPLSGSRSFTIDLTDAKYDKLGRYLSMLAREWGTDGPSETVYRAVEQAAKAL